MELQGINPEAVRDWLIRKRSPFASFLPFGGVHDDFGVAFQVDPSLMLTADVLHHLPSEKLPFQLGYYGPTSARW